MVVTNIFSNKIGVKTSINLIHPHFDTLKFFDFKNFNSYLLNNKRKVAISINPYIYTLKKSFTGANFSSTVQESIHLNTRKLCP